jgi:hypothetical protein
MKRRRILKPLVVARVLAAARGPMSRHEREAFLRARGFQNVDATCGAAEKPNRPTIARCAALELNETSGGFHIYGHEGATRDLYGRPVTEANYHAIYLRLRDVEGLNGVGMTQLTAEEDQAEADALGGCWNKLYNCDVGFHILHENIERGGVWWGFAAYNGGDGFQESGGRAAAEAYGTRAVNHERQLIREGLR